MRIQQHDGPREFRFVLDGELAGEAVLQLEQAWMTAKSILGEKELMVDISALTKHDGAGIELLDRMRESGARLSGALPPKPDDPIRSVGMVAAAPLRRFRALWALLLTRLAALSNNMHERERAPRRAGGVYR